MNRGHNKLTIYDRHVRRHIQIAKKNPAHISTFTWPYNSPHVLESTVNCSSDACVDTSSTLTGVPPVLMILGIAGVAGGIHTTSLHPAFAGAKNSNHKAAKVTFQPKLKGVADMIKQKGKMSAIGQYASSMSHVLRMVKIML